MRFDDFDFETSFGTKGQLLPSDLPEIAFSGRSNVGKSSLINKLLNRKNLARTSSVPGKTATINFFKGSDVRLVDLPGYGYAKVPKSEKIRWSKLMEAYFASERDLKLVVQIIDMRHKPSELDYDMLNFMKAHNINFIIAMTKCDKLKKKERLKREKELESELAEFNDYKRLPCSAISGEGIEEIRQLISESVK
ncbi:MAG: YihA family ribosome biogenesis GTP-binding protein [Clostridiales bacterium]|nr:YihA family ribosome biogenesis GTP-binding protein [Clostridiales bacterium]